MLIISVVIGTYWLVFLSYKNVNHWKKLRTSYMKIRKKKPFSTVSIQPGFGTKNQIEFGHGFFSEGSDPDLLVLDWILNLW